MLRIYDEFLEDETVLSLKDRSYRVHVSALIYCSRNLTDGEVTDRAVKVLQVILGFPLKRHIADLVEAEMWVPIVGGGYRIRNFLEFNPESSTVKRERGKARKRMKVLRDKRAAEGSDECSPERAGEGDGAVPYQSLPVLSFKEPEPKAVTSYEGTASVEQISKPVLKEAS